MGRIVICREQSMPYAGWVGTQTGPHSLIENVIGGKHEIGDEANQLSRTQLFATEESDRVPALF